MCDAEQERDDIELFLLSLSISLEVKEVKLSVCLDSSFSAGKERCMG